MIPYKEMVNNRKLFNSVEEYMESEFPNYTEGFSDVCKQCKEPISPKQKSLFGGLCKLCWNKQERSDTFEC